MNTTNATPSTPRYPGEIDQSFGSDDGKTLLEVPGFPYTTAHGITRGPGDELYITGGAHDASSFRVFFWIARLSAEGELDTSFGAKGFVIGQFEENNLDSRGHKITLLEGNRPEDRKILLTGTMNTHCALARFTLDGEPDLDFGVGGKIVHHIELSPPADNTPSFKSTPTMADQQGETTTNLLPGGKILISRHYVHSVFQAVGLLIRLNKDGSLDYSFNQIGYITVIHPDYLFTHTQLLNITVDTDGKYLGCGSVYDSQSPAKAMFVRYHPDGSLDQSFGDRGFTIIPDKHSPPLYLRLEKFSLLSDGGVIGFGNTVFPPKSGILIALDKNGVINAEFNEGAPLYTRIDELGTSWTTGTVQPDGNIVAAGAAHDPEYPDYLDFAVARYLNDGKPDPTFNNGKGSVRTRFSIDDDGALAVVLQSTGKIVLAGVTHDIGIVVRYFG